MRSMPPASSHLADRPVPAPPPMIGTPRRFMSWNLSSRALRSKRGMALLSSRVLDLGQGGDCGFGEGRVVDVVWQADQAAVRRLAEAAHDGVEESTVGGRVVERLARRIPGRDAALRQQEANRPLHAVQPPATPTDNRKPRRRGKGCQY